MTDRELLKMALHALKFSQNMKRCFARAEQDYHEKIAPITINALEAALAQPEQEPVAWMAWNMEDECYVITTDKRRLPAGTPLYTAPVSKPDTRLKVKLGRQYGGDLNGHWFYLQPADEYAELALTKHSGISAPSSKPWVSLTDEEIAACGWCDLKFARAIEAALRSKNT
jgi:hypothetical protein